MSSLMASIPGVITLNIDGLCIQVDVSGDGAGDLSASNVLPEVVDDSYTCEEVGALEMVETVVKHHSRLGIDVSRPEYAEGVLGAIREMVPGWFPSSIFTALKL